MGLVAPDALDPAVLTMQSIHASVIIADIELRILHAEGPAFELHGYQTADWPGRSLSDVLPGRLMTDLEPRYRAAVVGATGTLQAVFSQVIDIAQRKEHEARFEADSTTRSGSGGFATRSTTIGSFSTASQSLTS
jgi:hypothetical protein